MDLINATKMQASYTMGIEPDGRELLVVVVKGTFNIPKDGGEPTLLEQQVPLIDADVCTGEPGYSAPLYEIDYAPYKGHCDVLLNGNAYAPNGRPVRKVPVKLRVGTLNKEFDVIGDRFWQVSKGGYSQTYPNTFIQMPISYDLAFGGSDNQHPDKSKHSAYMPNPIGHGYHVNISYELMHGKPLPNTEERGKPISIPAGKYKPMAFGVYGRGWEPRYRYGGTYDQNWIDNVFPFLPSDFNPAYYQAAPLDQQIKYLTGGEVVELDNLSPQGRTVFRLPKKEVPVVFFRKKGGKEETQAVADTLLLEPDLNRFTITWRTHIFLKRNILEVSQVVVGEKSRAWWRARESGKKYFPSLAHVVADHNTKEGGDK